MYSIIISYHVSHFVYNCCLGCILNRRLHYILQYQCHIHNVYKTCIMICGLEHTHNITYPSDIHTGNIQLN